MTTAKIYRSGKFKSPPYRKVIDLDYKIGTLVLVPLQKPDRRKIMVQINEQLVPISHRSYIIIFKPNLNGNLEIEEFDTLYADKKMHWFYFENRMIRFQLQNPYFGEYITARKLAFYALNTMPCKIYLPLHK